MKKIIIDRDKLRSRIRKSNDEYIYWFLDEAIELLPQSKLVRLVKPYFPLEELAADKATKNEETSGNLLDKIQRFQKASASGKYYEDFMVNSKNYTEFSKGTRAWISEYRRLLDSCIKAVKNGDLAIVRKSFEILFDLLRILDQDPDSIIFFADEAGSWQVACDWRRIFPAWFRCLSATSGSEEYALQVVEITNEFEQYNRETNLASARRLANPEQKQALEALLNQS